RNLVKRPSQKEIQQRVRDRVARMAGVELRVQGNNGPPVAISILGPDSGKLTTISQELMAKLAKVRGIVDLESSEKGANRTVGVTSSSGLGSGRWLATRGRGSAAGAAIAGGRICRWRGRAGRSAGGIGRLRRGGREITAALADLYLTSSRVNADGSPMLVPL